MAPFSDGPVLLTAPEARHLGLPHRLWPSSMVADHTITAFRGGATDAGRRVTMEQHSSSPDLQMYALHHDHQHEPNTVLGALEHA